MGEAVNGGAVLGGKTVFTYLTYFIILCASLRQTDKWAGGVPWGQIMENEFDCLVGIGGVMVVILLKKVGEKILFLAKVITDTVVVVTRRRLAISAIISKLGFWQVKKLWEKIHF